VPQAPVEARETASQPTGSDQNALTINEAAETSGWSARMLRYIESVGLVEPPRSPAGYRLYGPGELQRLRTLRELLQEHGLEIGDVGFARRLRDQPQLSRAVNDWLDQTAERPADVSSDDWLSWEQQKHNRLLADPTLSTNDFSTTPDLT
jgi:DNA-binding transcriptional MerR regulator